MWKLSALLSSLCYRNHIQPAYIQATHQIQPVKTAQKAYIIIGQRWGKNSEEVMING